MSRIVITTFGSFGDVNPYIGLALELKRRGHQPLLAMPGIFREAVEREGLEFRAIRPDLNPDDAALTARIMDPARGSETIFSELLIPQLQATYDDLTAAVEGADLLVTHPASMVGPIVAQKRRMSWASTVLAPMSFFSVSDPVVPPPAPWLHPLMVRSRAISRAFVWLSDRVTRRWIGPVQRFRTSLGLPEGNNPILAGQHSPSLVLALFSRVLAEPQPDWPANTVLAGPILFNGAATPEVSEELERFLHAGAPPIVFTLGTSAVEAAGSFYEVSAAAARRLSRRAVLLVGRHSHNRPRVATRGRAGRGLCAACRAVSPGGGDRPSGRCRNATSGARLRTANAGGAARPRSARQCTPGGAAGHLPHVVSATLWGGGGGASPW